MARFPRIISRLIISSVALAAVLNANAFACLTKPDRVFDDILIADVIFEGRVREYHGVGCQVEPVFGECHALLGIDVSETIYGENRPFWTLYWGNSIYGIPENWEYDEVQIFAGQWVQSGRLPVRSGSATTVSSMHPDLLQLVQAPCSDPFILPATTEMKERISKLIEKKSEAQSE